MRRVQSLAIIVIMALNMGSLLFTYQLSHSGRIDEGPFGAVQTYSWLILVLFAYYAIFKLLSIVCCYSPKFKPKVKVRTSLLYDNEIQTVIVRFFFLLFSRAISSY